MDMSITTNMVYLAVTDYNLADRKYMIAVIKTDSDLKGGATVMGH
jgi:hypothetical protein